LTGKTNLSGLLLDLDHKELEKNNIVYIVYKDIYIIIYIYIIMLAYLLKRSISRTTALVQVQKQLIEVLILNKMN